MIPARFLNAAAMAAGAPTWRLAHADGTPYLDRTVLWGADCLEHHDFDAPSHAFVHHIHGADGDRHCHSHPWVWAVALVLSGGYEERRGDGGLCRRYDVGDINILRPDDYHSIVHVEPDTWTLFLCGREHPRGWGFLVGGVHVPHREYARRADAQAMTTRRIA